jgi:hypothetical protein
MMGTMPRPLTPASVRVLNRVARYGLYLWAPGSVAVLDDRWRSAVHAGSVRGLVERGLVEQRGEFEASVTDAGFTVLKELAGADGGEAVTIANTTVACVVSGLDSPADCHRAGQRILDSLRILANSDPAAWEHLVDCELAGRENPILSTVLDLVGETLASEPVATGELDLALTLTFSVVGPQRRSPPG